ncbi:MAG: hypothetical protein JKY08_07435 [Flavobacteriaceae bacterium]|nr:hypothetical protein [Flavobacteriaceae bacterium]
MKSKIFKDLAEASHTFRASTQLFPSINIKKLSKDLAVHTIGKERGEKDLPLSSDKDFDTLELMVIEHFEDENKAAQATFEDEHHIYHTRLASLDFKGEFEKVRKTSATSVADFDAEVQAGIDELHGLRDALNDASEERKTFRNQHKISRAARINSPSKMWLKISLIVLLVIIETALNGVYLAEGSSQGLFGGIGKAFSFAILNIIISLLLSIFAVRLITHKHIFLKLFGFIFLLIYLAAVISINLALAHYREVAPIFFEQTGIEVMNRLLTAPYIFKDINSWILFGIGSLFSVIAFIDGWYLSDPYVGYAGVEKRLRIARDNYKNMRKENIQELQDIRDDFIDDIENIGRDISSRVQEHETIIASRIRLVSLLKEHQDQLNRAANILISEYRDANIEARTTRKPKSFSVKFKLSSSPLPEITNESWNSSKLTKDVIKMQNELSNQIKEVSKAFQKALERYNALDDLHPDL